MNNEELKIEQGKIKFDKERAEAFVAMMKTQGWQLYVELINAHIADRTQNLFAPTAAGQELLEQHNKGAVYGLLLARDLPSATVNTMKDIPTPASGDE